ARDLLGLDDVEHGVGVELHDDDRAAHREVSETHVPDDVEQLTQHQILVVSRDPGGGQVVQGAGAVRVLRVDGVLRDARGAAGRDRQIRLVQKGRRVGELDGQVTDLRQQVLELRVLPGVPLDPLRDVYLAADLVDDVFELARVEHDGRRRVRQRLRDLGR